MREADLRALHGALGRWSPLQGLRPCASWNRRRDNAAAQYRDCRRLDLRGLAVDRRWKPARRGSDDFPDYSGYADEYLEQFEADVTASQVIDPWESDSPDEGARAGRRYVAVEVTIEASGEFPHYVSSSSFKLLDRDNFAYAAVPSLQEPALAEGLELAPGQKTRGWVMFEIDEGTEVKAVAYGTAEVKLPGSQD